MPRIAKQKDRTVIYKSRRGTHASCYAFKRLAKYQISDACMIEIQKAPSDKERTDKRIKGNQDYQCAKNIQRIISTILFWWI